MKAVGIYGFGGPEVLEVVEIPDPVAGSGEILIRVHAAAINPTDTLIRNGTRFRGEGEVGPPPFIPGMDAAGVVEAIGPDTQTDLKPGDHVISFVVPIGRHGAYAEKVAVPVESVVRAPKGASHAQASTLLLNAMTARVALDELGLKAGQSLAVSGSAGAVGLYAIQLAKADGLVVVADASAGDLELVKSAGPDFIVSRDVEFGDGVRKHLPDGADGAIDGALLNDRMARAVRDNGKVITLRMYSQPGERGVTFTPIRSKFNHKDTHMLDRLRQQVDDGVLTLRVAATYPKEQAADAHRRLEAGGVRGRLVIEF